MRGLAEFGVIGFYQASLLVSEQMKHFATVNRTELDVCLIVARDCYSISFEEVDFAASVAAE